MESGQQRYLGAVILTGCSSGQYHYVGITGECWATSVFMALGTT